MKQDQKAHSFGGRIRPKQPKPNATSLIALPHERKAFIYQRLSTHEQTKKSVYSIKIQDALADLAKEDGYSEEKIYVERRDLGISGTLGQDKREGLAHLIYLIEHNEVESVYVVHISRLFRDQTLIDGLSFGELCKAKNVIIVMPNMRLNLRDKMHMRIYRIELERAADELELMQMRLGGPKQFKGKQGFYCGGRIPLGYVLDAEKESPTYQKYKPYPPHAKVVKVIFNRLLASNGSPRAVVKYCKDNDIYIEPFSEEVASLMVGKHGLLDTKLTDKGYMVSESLVRSVSTNPVYIGWWFYGGEVTKHDNHEPIIKEELFWAVQDIISRSNPKPRGKKSESPSAILAGLTYCGKHDELYYVSSSYSRARKHRFYRCCLDYRRGHSDELCFTISDYAIERPVVEFVIEQCSYSEYADEILDHLKGEYEKAKDKTAALKREYKRLTTEIENLKTNLALTKTPQQVSMILEMVDEKMKERERLTRLESQPVGRVFSAAAVETVKKLLSDIKSHWANYPNELKNEFLRVVLDKVIVYHNGNTIRAEILWQSGMRQEILIKLPPANRGNPEYSEKEDEILRKHYANTSKEELMRMLPGRSWVSIKKHANKVLGLKRNFGKSGVKKGAKRRLWTEEEDDVLCRYYAAEITKDEMMSRLERPSGGITRRANYLELEWKPRNENIMKLEWEVLDFGEASESIGESDDKQAALRPRAVSRSSLTAAPAPRP